MENDIRNIETQFIEFKVDFKEHEREHRSLTRSIMLFFLASLSSLIAIGVWVGSVNTDVSHLQSEIKDKVSKSELANVLSTMDAMQKTLDKIADKLNII